MNSESLLRLASCESVFSYCCPVSHVVDAYCLSDFYLTVSSVFVLFSLCALLEAVLHPFQHLDLSRSGMQKDVRSYCFLPFPLLSVILTLARNVFLWGFLLFSVQPLHPSPPRLRSSHIELYDSH